MSDTKTEETKKHVDRLKKRIDKTSYAELLSHWRSAAPGDSCFMGEVGDYYAKVMKERRESISNAEHVATSKAIG